MASQDLFLPVSVIWEAYPATTFRERLLGARRPDPPKPDPEHAWLAKLLESKTDRPVDEVATGVSFFDIDDDGRATNYKWADGFRAINESDYPRKSTDRVRIIYVDMKSEELFNSDVINKLTFQYLIKPNFFFDHFLPSLSCDKPIQFEGKDLTWPPPIPSQHRYFRLKDCGGRNISATFFKDGSKKTVLILGPPGSPPGRGGYKWTLQDFGKRPAGVPAPTIYNGSEYMYPIVRLLLESYSRYIHDLERVDYKLQNFEAHDSKISATIERLVFCKRNIKVLGDPNNQDTQFLGLDIGYLEGHLRELRTQVRDRHNYEIQRLSQEAQNESLKAAIKSLTTALESKKTQDEANKLGESVWRLTLLAFVFIPLSFTTSFFAMHLQLLGFKETDGGLPTWSFFAVAVPLEVIVFAVYLLSGFISKVLKDWRGRPTS